MRFTVMLTALALVGAAVVALGTGGTKTANAEPQQRISAVFAKNSLKEKEKIPRVVTERCGKGKWINGIRFLRTETWDYQWRLERPYSPARKLHRRYGCSFLRWMHHHWEKKTQKMYVAYAIWFKNTYAKWECIHQHEAGWFGDNNPTYDGGLQMDSGFQNTYGSEFVRAWGNASNWPVWAQLRAAERAYWGYGGHGPRYFGPWPTRQYC